LHLGERAAQRVVLARAHAAQVQADSLDEAALGTLVHDLLSEVRDVAHWAQVRGRFASRWTLSAADRETVLTWADRVFQNPQSARFFIPGIHVECEPEWAVDGRLIRPDRVVRDGGEWHVVDFKSGEENVPKHEKQVREYVDVLEAMEGVSARGWVLYLNPWRLVEVTANHAPRIFEAD
jgi:ATP-dependent exoDNAse (exonuclease V) beta subunit